MNAIALGVALPLLAAFLTPSLHRLSRLAAYLLGPITLVALLVVIAKVAFDDGGTPFSMTPFSIALGGFAPPLGINFYVDGVALLFAALIAIMALLLWPWSLPESSSAERPRQYALTLLLIAASTGLCLSGDLFNIYVFYELLSVASFGLVAAKGSRSSLNAAFRYLVLSAFGTVMMLTGIALIYSAAGTLNLAQLAEIASTALNDKQALAAFALILLGIGVKAELFPVNQWVPEVYATTDRRVAALLAGLVSKIAALIVLRLLVLIFPGDESRELLLLLGAIGVLLGELAAWRATDMPRMLAYSSIGQLSLVFIAFAIPGEAGVLAGLALALHHLIIKPALFLLASRWGGALRGLSGIAWRGQLWPALLFVVLGMSLVGVPPLPGFWAKFLLIKALLAEAGTLHYIALTVVLSATVLEANYLFTLAVSMFHRDEATPERMERHARVDWITSLLLVAALLAVTLLIVSVGDELTRIAAQAADVTVYIETVNPLAEPAQ